MILINDQPYAAAPSDQTVRDLAREVCAPSRGEARQMVVAVYCEGRPVTDDELNAVLDAPIGRFGELALQTQPVAALVRATLDQAIRMLEDAAHIRTTTADLLDRGDQPAAMQRLQTLLEIWRQVQQSLVFSAEALAIPLDDLEVSGCRFADLVQSMRSSLNDLRDAMRNQDAVLIGDLLRYDLDEVFADWNSLLAGLKASLVAQ